MAGRSKNEWYKGLESESPLKIYNNIKQRYEDVTIYGWNKASDQEHRRERKATANTHNYENSERIERIEKISRYAISLITSITKEIEELQQ